MTDKKKENMLSDNSRADKFMATLWIAFLVVGLGAFGIIIYDIVSYEDDPVTHNYYHHVPVEKKIVPRRGNILDCKGRVLATSNLVFDMHLDCKAAHDTVWNKALGPLSDSLAVIFPKWDAKVWQDYLQAGKTERRGGLPICEGVNSATEERLVALPMFNLGRFKGGLVVKERHERFYPYGRIAYRTLGYVKDSTDTLIKNKKIGIEGAYDTVLYGKNGCKVMRKSDFGLIPMVDERNKEAIPGKNVRSTLDIDIQTIADRALRKYVTQNELIEKSCVIVLESKTGAIRAMVNLGRNGDGSFGEIDNYAVKMAEAPGSVFKGVVVMALMEDGYVKSLEQKIPTYGGKWKYKYETFNDEKHVGRHRFPSGYIKLREAFEMSANNPFMQLVCDERHYGSNPARFVDKLKSLGLFDSLEFDLPGIAPPFILDPTMKKHIGKGTWDGGTFPRMGIGYGMELSPLSLVTFYNAIANRGVMYKPYLVDAILDGDKVERQFEPVVLHEHICRKEVADTLARVLGMVTSDANGTAYHQLKDAVCPIAGKTGTAQRVFKKKNGRYGRRDEDGTESQQGSFVGFFPKDDPEYTAIVVVWGIPSRKNLFGATWAAPVFREIADRIYCLNDGRQMN